MADPGIVDQDMQAAQCRGSIVDCLFEGCAVRYVELERDRVPAAGGDFGNDGVCFVLVDIGDRDGRAGIGVGH